MNHKKWSFIIAFLLLLSHDTYANFDPDLLSQSTVRIVVKTQGKVVSVASGFVWQTPHQIVTSLHVMDEQPGTVIIVEFEKKRRKAVLKGVLPEADLALLEVKRPIKTWLPLQSFEQQKPPYKSTVTAMGFNKGALGMSTRELVKGFAKPEVLAKLLPQKSARILARSKMPRVDLPIYYLDGSLLPGYSGSPVVNEDGKLIGIGNGGLENGASSVSWVIPANNLQQLLTSSITTIPDAFIVSKALFSGDRIASRRVSENVFDYKPYKPDSPLLSFWRQIMPEANAQNSLDNSLDASLDDLNWSLPAFQFREVNYQNFQFVRIKSRSFEQMLASSGDPDSLNHALTLFDAFFPDYKVPYHNMAFDVYTDSHYGLNLIVPTGAKLTVEDGFLLAQGTLFCQLCPYEIQYHARDLNNQLQMAIAEDAPAYLNDIAHQHWGELNQEGDYQEYVGFRQVEDYGSGRHVLRAAFSDFDEPFKREHELNYFVAATNRDAWFQVQGIINVFDNRFSRQLKKYAGTDCSVSDLNQKQQAVCSEVTRAFKVLASAHFTSFSNRLF